VERIQGQPPLNNKLPVFPQQLEIALGVGAGGAHLRRFIALVTIPTVHAAPDYRLLSLEDPVVLYVTRQVHVPLLVLLFGNRDGSEQRRDIFEPLFVGHRRETGVHLGVFMVLAGGGRL
jgi:hypothetical protein